MFERFKPQKSYVILVFYFDILPLLYLLMALKRFCVKKNINKIERNNDGEIFSLIFLFLLGIERNERRIRFLVFCVPFV